MNETISASLGVQAKTLPPLEVLDLEFEIDYEAGVLRWRRPRKHGVRNPDRVAGSLHHLGYICVKFAGRKISAHRIVWKLHHREEPPAQIDHKNGVRSDNRPDNLREATNEENQANSRLKKSNTSGHKGVSWSKSDQRWRVRCQSHGRTWQGNFKTLDAAAAAVKVARERLCGEFTNHG